MANLGVSVNRAQSVQTQSLVQAISNSQTSYSGTVKLSGAGGVTVGSQTGNAFTISGGGVQNLVASDATFSSGTVSITGLGAATVNTAASKIQVSVPTQTTQPGVANLVASDATFSSGTVSVTGVGGGVTVNTAASKIQVSVNSQTVQTQSINPKGFFWQNQPDGNLTVLSHLSAFSKTPLYFPVTLNGDMTLNSVGIRLSQTGTSVIQSFSVHFGLYTLANSTSANLLGSASDSFNLSSTNSVSYQAARDWVMTSPSTVAAISNVTAGHYVMGVMVSGAATQSMDASLVGGQKNSTQYAEQGVIFPGNNSFATATSQGLNGFLGQGSTTVAAMPAAVSVADLRNQGTATQPMVPYIFIRS